jgi:FKBP-type peptidyl-prolyl cis-trans isomerase FkpA
MKNLLLVLLCWAGLAAGCRSRNEIDSANLQLREDQVIREYLAANNIQAQRDASGIYYRILTPSSSGARPLAVDTVFVNYTGTALYGKIFDTTQFREGPTRFVVGETIPGWQIMLPQMQQGERRELYIPSTLAYGSAGDVDRNTGRFRNIPPNTILVFDVELVNIFRRR